MSDSESTSKAAPSPDMWSNQWIFVLAAAGSAIGLGNIWKFPYITGENGGGAFVLVYLLCIAVIGVPVMISEVLLGKLGRASPINSLLNLARQHNRSPGWSAIGVVGVIGGFLILSFYGVIAGWVCKYIVESATNVFESADAAFVGDRFSAFISDPLQLLLWFTLFMAITMFFVARGVTRGLELCVRYSMPAVFVLLLVLIGYGIHAGGFGESFTFLFYPDFSELTRSGVIVALGHAFFTLSLGMGAIMAYGAYVPQEVSVRKTAITITVLDTVIALLAGLAIFSIVFGNGLQPDDGPGLLFQTVPLAFGSLPLGWLFGTLFFILVGLAALTSAISLTEPAIAYCTERFGLSRAQTAVSIVGICWVLGIGSVLSFNLWAEMTVAGLTVFDMLDKFTQFIVLPLGGLFIALFTAWVLPRTTVGEALGLSEGWQRSTWQGLIGVVTPIAVLVVFITQLVG